MKFTWTTISIRNERDPVVSGAFISIHIPSGNRPFNIREKIAQGTLGFICRVEMERFCVTVSLLRPLRVSPPREI